MKKMFAMFALCGALMICFNQAVAQPQDGAVQEATEAVEAGENAAEEVIEAGENAAQEAIEAGEEAATEAIEGAEEAASNAIDAANEASEDVMPEVEETEEVTGFHQTVKKYFIEGGANFMSFVLICLIFGLALSIERIIYLNMATTNTNKLLAKVESALKSGGVSAAKDVCRNTRGPVASIFYQGLDRSNEEVGDIAKAIEDYGSVEMSKLEKGLSWISLFIALAPMLGFMGTVIGMISAFDKIEGANTINASIVAGGIKVALITTVSGLIVAIILQVFYNYILSKIDSIVLDMEEASMDLVDMLYKRQITK
ncbi:MAG: MotA/TolQ/ExbB proton channel family protein [Flavobacteriales bacterium]|nr:MotA/TolQ/ExbB proton channel family protein [Flavobacteriales bacterium]